MSDEPAPRKVQMPVGVVVRRAPGVTRWAKWSWTVSAVLPGAAHGQWKELRREGEAVEFHAATLPLCLFRTDTEAYLAALNNAPPLVWVILRTPPGTPDARPEPFLVTASAYEAQDYADNGEDLVEPVPMPSGLVAWVGAFVETHHRPEEFVKRKRRPHLNDSPEDGIGDARIRQAADVYRAPRSVREGGG